MPSALRALAWHGRSLTSPYSVAAWAGLAAPAGWSPRATLHGAPLAERVGFTEPVSDLARCGEGRPMERRGLIPVTALKEEAGHPAGNLARVQMPSVDGGMSAAACKLGRSVSLG